MGILQIKKQVKRTRIVTVYSFRTTKPTKVFFGLQPGFDLVITAKEINYLRTEATKIETQFELFASMKLNSS
jgi:hypothetical protein